MEHQTNQHTIIETAIEPRTYVVWRKEVAMSDISNKEMWDNAFKQAAACIQQNQLTHAGPGAALYFSWDTQKGVTDMGIGLPIVLDKTSAAYESITQHVADAGLSIVHTEKSAAAHCVVMGEYSTLPQAHSELMDYVTTHGHTPMVVIEEYAVMGLQTEDSSQWQTNLYHLYK